MVAQKSAPAPAFSAPAQAASAPEVNIDDNQPAKENLFSAQPVEEAKVSEPVPEQLAFVEEPVAEKKEDPVSPLQQEVITAPVEDTVFVEDKIDEFEDPLEEKIVEPVVAPVEDKIEELVAEEKKAEPVAVE